VPEVAPPEAHPYRCLYLYRVAGAGAAGPLTPGPTRPIAAFAQEPSHDPSASGTAARGARRGATAQAAAAALARKHGVGEERVAAALDKIDEERQAKRQGDRLAELKKRLDAPVTDDKLTREQADAIHRAAENDALPMGGRGGPGRPRG
jgi:hypothetical protein